MAERQRLATEIHDTLAQALTSIVMLLQAADAVVETDPLEARRHMGRPAGDPLSRLSASTLVATTLRGWTLRP